MRVQTERAGDRRHTTVNVLHCKLAARDGWLFVADSGCREGLPWKKMAGSSWERARLCEGKGSHLVWVMFSNVSVYVICGKQIKIMVDQPQPSSNPSNLIGWVGLVLSIADGRRPKIRQFHHKRHGSTILHKLAMAIVKKPPLQSSTAAILSQ